MSSPAQRLRERSGGLALVFGPGGARGFAHVGVLERLAAAEIPIHTVIGCSVGGLIAAFYAAGGYGPGELLDFGRQLSTAKLLRHAANVWLGRGKAAARGTPRRLLGYLETCSFDKLHHGVRQLGIVAYDLVRRQPILLTGRGEHACVTVREAATGGAAIPFLYPPKLVRRNGRRYALVDAGFLGEHRLRRLWQPAVGDRPVLYVQLPGPRSRWRRRLKGRADENLGSGLWRIHPAVEEVGTLVFRERDVPRLVEAGKAAVSQVLLREIHERLRGAPSRIPSR